MQFSIEKASELVNKSVKTLYRHMATGGLLYSVSETGSRQISLKELQIFYGIEIDMTVPNSQVRLSNENDIENKLDALLKIAQLQLEATQLNNKLLNESNKIALLKAPTPPPSKPEQVLDTLTTPKVDNYGYLSIPVFLKK